jgi:hypothetical protein
MMPEPDPRRCPICQAPLPPPKTGHDHRPQRTYCSRACAREAWRRTPIEARRLGVTKA